MLIFGIQIFRHCFIGTSCPKGVSVTPEVLTSGSSTHLSPLLLTLCSDSLLYARFSLALKLFLYYTISFLTFSCLRFLDSTNVLDLTIKGRCLWQVLCWLSPKPSPNTSTFAFLSYALIKVKLKPFLKIF